MPSWDKQRSSIGKWKAYVPTMIFASWVGTYLDLILVQKQLYSFPLRPFPAVFDMNLIFTLLVLPLVTAICIACLHQSRTWQRMLTILLFAIIATLVEQYAENLGWFAHSSEWRHTYSFMGYTLFIWLVWRFHRSFS